MVLTKNELVELGFIKYSHNSAGDFYLLNNITYCPPNIHHKTGLFCVIKCDVRIWFKPESIEELKTVIKVFKE